MKISQLFELSPSLVMIAGESGGDRTINYADVVEIPEGVNWVKEGDFIITTGFFLENDEQRAYEFVHCLIKKRAAGLGIKLGKHLHELPPQVVILCEKHHFPIVSIPQYMMYRDLMQPVNAYIASKRGSVLSSCEPEHPAQLLLGIMNGSIVGEPRIREACARFGIGQDTQYMLCQCSAARFINMQGIGDILKKIDLYCQSKGVIFFYDNSAKWYFLCPHNNSASGYHSFTAFASDLLYTLERVTAVNDISLGISLDFPGISLLHTAAGQSSLALSMGTVLREGNPLYFYADYAVDSLISDNIDHTFFKNFYDRTFCLLDRYDKQHGSELLFSLTTLIDCYFNINKTVEKLFLHRNTMYKRLEKISELLGSSFDIDSPKTRQLLWLISRYHKLMR